MIDIFLSYAHEDRERIQPLIRVLETQGWAVWWDTKIETGALFDMEIEAAVEAARCIMVVWSKHSIGSRWVRSEAHEGLDRNILVPVLLDDVRPPLPFRQIQAINLFDRPHITKLDQEDLFDAVRCAFEGDNSGRHASYFIKKKTGRRHVAGILGFGLLATLIIMFSLSYIKSYRESRLPELAQPDVTESAGIFQPPEKSIAVLPFVNLSGKPGDDYLGAGLAEDLMGGLARQSDLQVAARTSSFAFKDKSLSIAEIARQLRVRAILEGSIRTEGDQIRISAQLIDSIDGYQLWSQTFNSQLDQMQTIKHEIQINVARIMATRNGGIEDLSQVSSAPMTEVSEAYQYYLQGKYYWYIRGEDNIRNSIELFSKAIELDSNFARAYSSLAAAYVTLPEYSNEPVIPTYQKAQKAAQEALRLDNTIGEAFSVIAVINHWNWDWISAEADFRRAIEVEPTDPTSLTWYSELLVELGRIDESEVVLLKALRMDPVSPPINYLLSWLYLARGQNEEAMKFARLSTDLGQPYGYLVQSLVHLRENRTDEAIAARAKFSESLGVDAALGTDIIEAVTRPSGIPAVMERIEAMTEQGQFSSTSVFFNYFALQTDHILMGQKDGLFQLLDDLIDQHFVRVRVFWLPEAREIRQDPRMKTLTHKYGLAAAWRKNGPPDVCNLTNSGIECD